MNTMYAYIYIFAYEFPYVHVCIKYKVTTKCFRSDKACSTRFVNDF